VAVLVLGGSHHLGAEIDRQSGTAEYVRVRVRTYGSGGRGN
jgi:hypothetical protein